MSIYLRGAPMPKGANLMLLLTPEGEVYEMGDLLGNDRLLEGASALPVPDHGRLGDLDVLAQQIEHERFHHTHTDGLAARHHVDEYGHFLKAISDAPTIIPASKEEKE